MSSRPAPYETGSNGGMPGRRAMGPPVEAGQQRVDPAYPDVIVTVEARLNARWKVLYSLSGWVLLSGETIREVYPQVIAGPGAGED